GRGVFKSSDAALSWRGVNTGLSVTTGSSLAVDPSTSTTIYAGTPIGVFKSGDGGRRWSRIARGVVGAVVVDPRNPKVVLAAEAANKIIRSTDGGRTWRSAGAGIRTRPWALAISGDSAYALTFGRGVYASSDGGRTWIAPPSPLTRYARALAVAPDDPR